jgi:hypothetical protein
MKRFLSMILLTIAMTFGVFFPVSFAADVSTPAPVTSDATVAPTVPVSTPTSDANSVPAQTAPVETTTPPATTAETSPATSASPTVESTAAPVAAEPSNEGRTVVARVVWTKGTFNAAGPGGMSTRELKKDSKIYMNDTLTTDANSQAQIVFTDNSTMAFREDTKFYINEYNYSPKEKAGSKSTGKYIMDLVAGGFRTVTGLVAKNNPNDYQVNTPVATIGVRGTEYSAFYRDGKLFTKRYKGEPCLSKKDKNGKAQTVCMDNKNKYGMADQNSGPSTSTKDIEGTFSGDVELLVATFAGSAGGGDGPGGSGGGSGFCIQ